jgi:hypothetical protein
MDARAPFQAKAQAISEQPDVSDDYCVHVGNALSPAAFERRKNAYTQRAFGDRGPVKPFNAQGEI